MQLNLNPQGSLARRLLLAAVGLAGLMLAIKNHFRFDAITYGGFVLLAPILLAGLCAAYLPNKLTLTVASLAWLLIALFLLDVFKSIYIPDSSPEFVSHLQRWAWAADVVQVLATLASATGLWLMWAVTRTIESKD